MVHPVYTGHDKFLQVGSVRISTDRIVYADISYTFTDHIGTVEGFVFYNNQKDLFPKTTLSIKGDIQYSFDLKKISRSDFAYRNAKLTHELISNDLKKQFNGLKFFIKLSFLQRLKVAKSLKKFYWQSQDFKTHIYKYVTTLLIGCILGYLLSNIFVKPCDDQIISSSRIHSAHKSNENPSR